MSAGGGNSTIAWPGKDWHMIWGYGDFQNFQLDIVGFLAVLGEGSVLANSQVSALSPLFYLPRILPAPQALLPPNRPAKLPSTPASVTAVSSGNSKDHVHHVAHVLLGEELPTFTVRCVQIRKKDPTEKNGRHVNKFLAPLDTFVRKAGTLFRSRSGTPSTPDNPVTANTTGPLALVTLLGCLLSIIIFVVSIVWGDGMSMIALILLSSLSTLTGVANKWELKLPKKPDGETPPGDTVIRYPNGSFLVIKCNEEIARELFFAPEEIEYRLSDPASYRYVSLIGTVILMLGIIALANAKLQLQFAWAGAYIIINAAHWLAAAVPQKYHWDLSCYELEEQGVQGGPTSQTFTEALWKAIVLTKDVRWVKNGKAAPQTRVWDYWLEEAQTQSKNAHSVSNTQLMDPMYPHDRPTRAGTVWLLPPRWNPRTAWNELNQDAPRVDAA